LLFVEEDKQIVASSRTERAVLMSCEVETTATAMFTRMLGFHPHLAGFDLYGRSPERVDIKDGGGIYREVKNGFSYALSNITVVVGAGIGIDGLHDNLSVRLVYIDVDLVMGRVI
jgi:hypothetical protein